MTTAGEIRQLLGNYLAEAQRVVLRPSGLLTSEGGRDEIAKDVVALANRDGGRIILGISESGAFEGSLEVSHDEAEAALEDLLAGRMTPAVDATVEHLATPDGEVLIVGVPRRSGPPHAFARVSPRGSVSGRAFLVRDGARTLPVSDAQLRWLFAVESDPALEETFRLTLHLPEDGVVPTSGLPQPRAAERFARLLGGLDDGAAARLAADPPSLESAFMEVAPFALLQELEAVLRRWRDERDLAVRELRLDDMPVPGRRAVLGADGDGLRRLLARQGAARFLLPAEAELQLDFLFHQGKARLLVDAPAFTLTLSALPEGTGDGLTWTPGQAAAVRWVRLRVDLSCSFTFPGRDDSFDDDAAGLVEDLAAVLRVAWDSERLRRSLASSFLEQLSARQG